MNRLNRFCLGDNIEKVLVTIKIAGKNITSRICVIYQKCYIFFFAIDAIIVDIVSIRIRIISVCSVTNPETKFIAGKTVIIDIN